MWEVGDRRETSRPVWPMKESRVLRPGWQEVFVVSGRLVVFACQVEQLVFDSLPIAVGFTRDLAEGLVAKVTLVPTLVHPSR